MPVFINGVEQSAGHDVPTADSTDNAQLSDVVGNKADAAVAGDPEADESIVAILKQLVNILMGTAGIVAWPAAAAPANGVSLAEALRQIYDDLVVVDNFLDTEIAAILAAVDTEVAAILLDTGELQTDWTNDGRLDLLLDAILALVDSAETAGPFSYLDAGGEQDVVEDTATTRRRVSVEIDLDAMTQNGTIRIHRKVDGTNYRIYTETAFVAADAEQAFDAQFTTNQAWKLTYQEAVNEGANRSIPFNTIIEVIE